MDIVGDLTPQQQRFQSEVKEFTLKHCHAARVAECDENGEPPLEVFRALAERGWLGIGTSEEYGGMGGGAVEFCILLEQLEYSFIQLGSLVSRGAFYLANVLKHYGTEEQRKELLPLVIRGDLKAVVGISEPNAGSDMSGITSTATRDNRGGDWLINGEKMYLTGFDYADVIVLAAVTDSTAKRAGISVFLVDTKSPGITVSRLQTMGAWQNRTFHGAFNDVAVTSSRLIGEENGGWKVLGGHNERERAGIAARSVGAAQAVLDAALEHAKSRVQFGKPIGEFQVNAHKLADMHIEILVTRAAVYELARRIDRGENCVADAAAIKVFATEMYNRVANEGLQIFGGSGYMRESDMQRHFRDARLLLIGGGTSEIQRNIVARSLGL